jgi:hypothetical protein
MVDLQMLRHLGFWHMAQNRFQQLNVGGKTNTWQRMMQKLSG